MWRSKVENTSSTTDRFSGALIDYVRGLLCSRCGPVNIYLDSFSRKGERGIYIYIYNKIIAGVRGETRGIRNIQGAISSNALYQAVRVPDSLLTLSPYILRAINDEMTRMTAA